MADEENQDDDADFAADEAARIAALHQSAPEVIWLQADPEAEQFDGWEAQTWCSDRINATDVEYIKATERDALKAHIITLLEILRQWEPDHASGKDRRDIVMAMYQVGILTYPTKIAETPHD